MCLKIQTEMNCEYNDIEKKEALEKYASPKEVVFDLMRRGICYGGAARPMSKLVGEGKLVEPAFRACRSLSSSPELVEKRLKRPKDDPVVEWTCSFVKSIAHLAGGRKRMLETYKHIMKDDFEVKEAADPRTQTVSEWADQCGMIEAEKKVLIEELGKDETFAYSVSSDDMLQTLAVLHSKGLRKAFSMVRAALKCVTVMAWRDEDVEEEIEALYKRIDLELNRNMMTEENEEVCEDVAIKGEGTCVMVTFYVLDE